MSIFKFNDGKLGIEIDYENLFFEMFDGGIPEIVQENILSEITIELENKNILVGFKENGQDGNVDDEYKINSYEIRELFTRYFENIVEYVKDDLYEDDPQYIKWVVDKIDVLSSYLNDIQIILTNYKKIIPELAAENVEKRNMFVKNINSSKKLSKEAKRILKVVLKKPFEEMRLNDLRHLMKIDPLMLRIFNVKRCGEKKYKEIIDFISEVTGEKI